MGRSRAVLSHDASFGQDERRNLQPRQDGHQHADARRSGGRGRAPQPEHCQDFRYSPAIFKTGTMARGVAPAALPIKFSRAGGCYVSLPKLCTSAPLQCSQNYIPPLDSSEITSAKQAPLAGSSFPGGTLARSPQTPLECSRGRRPRPCLYVKPAGPPGAPSLSREDVR